MYCVLHPDYALRSWLDLPFAAIGIGKSKRTIILSAKEFSVLIQADGMHDIEESMTTEKLLSQGLLLRCEKGESILLPTQDYLFCDNHFIESALLEITFRCNMNCKHCFIYSDNVSNNIEMSINDFDRILDSVYKCGVKQIALTGGEPLLHKELPRMLDSISEHLMTLSDLFTNGILLDDELLDRIISHGFFPRCHISFDGLGYHDSFRGVPGSEKKVLEAIKRCVDKQIMVIVNVNINAENKEVILQTLDVLDEIGVSEVILIRTSESPRWKQNHGKSIAIQDLYDYLIELLIAYTSKPHHTRVRMAHIMNIDVQRKEIFFNSILGCVGSCINTSVCNDARHMLTIGATGNVYPCPEISGVMDAMGIKFENALVQSVKEILQEGKYADWMKMKTQSRIQHSDKCRKCRYREICMGGCPAISCVTPDHYGDFWGYNPWQCSFFEGNYAAKLLHALPEYKCMNPGIEDILQLSEFG